MCPAAPDRPEPDPSPAPRATTDPPDQPAPEAGTAEPGDADPAGTVPPPPHADPEADAGSTVRADAIPEAETGSDTAAGPEAAADARPEADAGPAVRADAIPEAETEAAAETDPEADAGSDVRGAAEPEAETGSDTAAGPEAAADARPEADAGPAVRADAIPEAETEAAAETDPEADAGSHVRAGAEPEPGPDAGGEEAGAGSEGDDGDGDVEPDVVVDAEAVRSVEAAEREAADAQEDVVVDAEAVRSVQAAEDAARQAAADERAAEEPPAEEPAADDGGTGGPGGSDRPAGRAARFETDLGTITPAGTTVLVPPVLAGLPPPPARVVDAGDEPPVEEDRPGILGRARDRFTASRWWRWGRWFPVVVLVALAAAVIGLLWLFATVDLPGETPEASSTVLLDAKGRELALLSDDQLQLPVKLDQMAPDVAASLVAAEDRSFYDHLGIDPVGIARALHRNLTTQDVEGASTITQQLVKNEFLGSERTWRRKVEEAVLAVKLERRADKTEILERYLNTVYFGRGARGIESAARVYFDRSARDLTTAQAAYLVGLLPAPSNADPMAHPVVAARRRNRVLDARVATGSLTPAQAAAARAEPLLALPSTRPVTLTAGVAPHYVEWVRDLLIDRYGEAGVYGTGLRVRTTLDLDDQRAAEQAVLAALDDPADPQAALVAVDRTGAVRAYVGARPGSGTHVDMARGVAGGGRGRQAGSTFKPFALAAALERGVPLNRPLAGPSEITLSPPSGPWTVHNYGGQGFGTVSLLDATVSSVNTVYAQLGLETGPAAVADAARRAGIRSPLGANPSIVLGVDDVAPVEMAGAYLTFARDGRSVEPFAIAEIRDVRGELVLTADDTSRDALDPGVARSVNAALQQAVARGTGTAARLDRPVAGKTGTTESNGDAWFAGYTPEYAAVVWMGYAEGAQRRMTNVRGRAITGGSIPAEIWKAFAEPALADVPPTPFAPPPPERMGAPPAPPAITLQSDVVTPGEPIRVAGTGLAACTADFQVLVLPEQAAPGAQPTLRSSPEKGSSEATRRADIALPASMPPGRWRAVAFCDDGRGTRPVAEARFTVAEARPIAAVSSIAS